MGIITQWMEPLLFVEAPESIPTLSKQGVATFSHSPSSWKVKAGRLEFKVGLGHMRTWLARRLVGKGCPAALLTCMIPRAHTLKGENQVPTSRSVTSCAHTTHTHNLKNVKAEQQEVPTFQCHMVPVGGNVAST